MADEAGRTREGALWGGRFREGPAFELRRLSQSTHFDWRLAVYDIDGSLAHLAALEKAGLAGKEDAATLRAALKQIKADLYDDIVVPAESDEDVHGALERELIARVGPEIGGILRAGRSRNDQIATFIRMYLRDTATAIQRILLEIVRILIERSEEAGDRVMPGRTHFQHAQPILVAHYLLAHAWPVIRDIQRLDDWAVRNNQSPYGGGALAGGGLGLDAEQIAVDLGFSGLVPNSLDGTSSRDGVAEFLYIAAQIGIDVSRLAEEIIIFTTAEFGYITLHDSYATGSSMMPQKKNPDIAELARGKSGRLLGNLTGLLATLKALPLAYNRDLQEDKEPVFDSVDTLLLTLPAVAGLLASMTLHYDRMESLATAGFSLATDVADWLAVKGVPFREAHEIAGALVAACEARGVDLAGLTDDEYAAISRFLDGSVREILTAAQSVAKKNGPSGTALESVQAQRESLKRIVEQLDR